MRKIQESSEDEMIALFLQTEFRSARFHQTLEALAQHVRIDPALLRDPNWHDANENAQRRALLGRYCGYGRNEGYFQGFPPRMPWAWVRLTKQELEQVRYIEYDYWVAPLRGHTHACGWGQKCGFGKSRLRRAQLRVGLHGK